MAVLGDYKNKLVFGLFGAGGFAREVMPFAKENIKKIAAEKNIEYEIFFIETNTSANAINSFPIISEAEFLKLECIEKLFNVAIADSKAREKIAGNLMACGAKPITLISPHAIIYENNEIGEGAIICAFSCVTSNAKIGRFFHSNIYSYVAHDCTINDFVTFAPRVNCNGHTHIHNHAYIGTSATIKPGCYSKPLIIGKEAVVGMGAVVTKNVDAHKIVVGNPAKVLDK
jgi:sugar O-acyltransferase (sialic acid O-acetyltransferase NeuD family)